VSTLGQQNDGVAPKGPGAIGFLAAEHSPERIAAWREAYLYGILIACVFLPFDFLYPQRLPWTLATRGALVAILIACRWLLGTAPRSRAGRVVVAGAIAAGVLAPAPVLLSSGSAGPRFGFLLSVPFILLPLLPEVPHVAVIAGSFSALVGGAVLLAERQPAPRIAEWTILASVVTWMLAFGARRVRALAGRADAAEQERRRVLAQLDASERRRAASERLALLGRLAAGVGHEINNPLSAVKGNVSCALEELERTGAPEPVREALVEALAAAERIAWIAADMRALTTDGSAPLVRCDVGTAVREALTCARGRLRHANVVTSLEPGLPGVRSEPRLLAEAIGQLAAQAARTTSLGGAGGESPTVRIGARRVAAGIEITIDDEGPRIPPHVLPSIFEPFAAQGQMRSAGLGLTLPLTRELAERSGGHVGATWHERGNRFTVTLAVAGDTEAA